MTARSSSHGIIVVDGVRGFSFCVWRVVVRAMVVVFDRVCHKIDNKRDAVKAHMITSSCDVQRIALRLMRGNLFVEDGNLCVFYVLRVCF